jgi:cell wall-associated NlpC family hydrolase
MVALCQVSYAQVRKEPDHTSELVSQIIFGEWVLIREISGDWILIETEHGYRGFTRTAQFEQIEREVALVAFQDFSFQIWPAGGKVFEFLGRMCLPGSFLNDFFAVPQGFKNWVWEEIPKSIDHPEAFHPEVFARLKQCFSGIPYVWGGKTIMGLDCSGLVQVMFHQMGYSFPRDAWQQAEVGDPVDFNPEKPEFQAGDLLYFTRPGKKIHHVAVSLGGSRYFHASEWTRENDFNPDYALFVQDRKDTLTLAKRIRTGHLKPLVSTFKEMISRA